MNRGLLACLALTALSCGPEELDTYYSSVEAARTAGAFKRGWLPDVLPHDARDIRERHNLDTNATWACFSTPTGVGTLRDKLASLKARPVTWQASESPGRPWWPTGMTSPAIEAYEFPDDRGLQVTVGLASTGVSHAFNEGYVPSMKYRPHNNEMQRTKQNPIGASPLISGWSQVNDATFRP